jgi:regulator of protease activity HflC (stomatin/prohibitin superfamily)
MSGTQKSSVVQMRIRSPIHASQVFDTAGRGGRIPLVLVPDWPALCHCGLSVPSGVWVLYQRWHKHAGLLPAGVKWFWPAFYRISHIVTKSSMSYNHPVRNVPTSDNVFCNVDVSLTFQVGPDEDAVVAFCYELGASRLDDMLTAQSEEAIRALVNGVPYTKVHDLRESFAEKMKKGLNKKVRPFGVVILNVKITSVALPVDLSKTLQNTTAYKTKMAESTAEHESETRVIRDEATQTMTRLQKTDARTVQDLEAQKERAVIEREQLISTARGALDIAKLRGETELHREVTRARAELDVAEAEAKRTATEVLAAMRAEVTEAKLQGDQRANAVIEKMRAKVDAARSRAEGVRADAEAEAKAAACLEKSRAVALEEKKIEALSVLARDGHFVISGESGEHIISALVPKAEA